MNSKPCIICRALSDEDRCPQHRAKWQRRYFYPCKYCGGHVKSYKSRRCKGTACFSRAMREAAARREISSKRTTRVTLRKKQVRYDHGGLPLTSCGWAKRLGKSPALIAYHLKCGRSIAEIITRFQLKPQTEAPNAGQETAHE